MKRFYLMLGVLTLALGAMLIYLLDTNPSAPRAATQAPAAVVDDGFRGYTLGSDSARIEVTEYSDFECPFCANFATVQMPTIREQLIATGKLRWRYRDFPILNHTYGRYAAHAAHCAGEQGKFWEMHDQLFYDHGWAQTGKNPTALFRDFAKAAGLDPARYDACMQSGRYAARIEFSRLEGLQRNVNGTPTFFVNGTELRSARLPASDDFKRLVDSLSAPPGAGSMRHRQAIAVLALVGWFVALYLGLHALGIGGELKCGSGACDTVQTSRWAVLLGIPVAFYGVAGYAAILAAALAGLQPSWVTRRGPTLLLAALATGGALFSGWLTYLELFVIHAICRWCVTSAVLMTAIWLVSLHGLRIPATRTDP